MSAKAPEIRQHGRADRLKTVERLDRRDDTAAHVVDLEPFLELPEQPDFPDAVLCEEPQPLVQIADARLRREHLEHHVRRPDEPFLFQSPTFVRHEHEIRLRMARPRLGTSASLQLLPQPFGFRRHPALHLRERLLLFRNQLHLPHQRLLLFAQEVELHRQ